ncbi:unnamed protein product [Pedinophyceae sp. YPF-701]|nr:unnamed protein product [Pedinophyceae sp. YPF-701]
MASFLARGGARGEDGGAGEHKRQLLPLQRANNVGIMMAALHKSPRECRRDIMACNVNTGDGLRLEQLNGLMQMVPSEDEAKRLADYEGSLDELTDPERMLAELAAVPRVRRKLHILTFMVRLDEYTRDSKNAVSAVQEACKAIRGSELLHGLLLQALAVGNVLNEGNAMRGAALGFRIEALIKLKDTKTTAGVRAGRRGNGSATEHDIAATPPARPSGALSTDSSGSDTDDADDAGAAARWWTSAWSKVSNLLEVLALAFLESRGWAPPVEDEGAGAGGDARRVSRQGSLLVSESNVGSARKNPRAAADRHMELIRSLPKISVPLLPIKQAMVRMQSDLDDCQKAIREGIERCCMELEELHTTREELISAGEDPREWPEQAFAEALDTFTERARTESEDLEKGVGEAKSDLRTLVAWLGEPAGTDAGEVLELLWRFAADFDETLQRVAGLDMRPAGQLMRGPSTMGKGVMT